MTSINIKRNYTAEETTAYEAYLSAVAEHNIVCARSGATTREKMDAAFSADAAWKRFCEVAGIVPGSTRSPGDIRTIERLNSQKSELVEDARSAWAMIRGAYNMEVIDTLPDGIDPTDHSAFIRLLRDAERLLDRALDKADSA